LKERTIITGGSGLVGSAINIPEAIKLSSADGDLTDLAVTEGLFRKLRPTSVIHCAARVGGLGGNMNHKGEFFYENVMMNTNVLEAARKNGVAKVVSFLSTCIFPDDVEYPLTEGKIHLGEPHHSNYPYAYAKRMIDIQNRAYREQYGLNYVSVVPTNIYGPSDNFDTVNGHVIPSLIHKCYLAKENGSAFDVWGSGSPLREFIFSKDLAKLTEWALEHYEEAEPIIFSTSREASIAEVVNIIVKEVGYTGEINWLRDKPDGQFRKPSDNSKLRQYLPEFEFTSIEEGLAETVKWFVDNYDEARK
jgi:GDP-L-fucose synthase